MGWPGLAVVLVLDNTKRLVSVDLIEKKNKVIFKTPLLKYPYSITNKTNHPILSNNHPSATANKATHSLKRGGEVQNQREHHIILRKYEAVHPKAVSENNSSSGMLI